MLEAGLSWEGESCWVWEWCFEGVVGSGSGGLGWK